MRDEKGLIKGLKSGDNDAYRILVERYQSRLINIAYGITLDRNESVDIVQEVFLKVFTAIKGFEEKILRPGPQCLDGVFHGGIASHHDRRNVGVQLSGAA